MDCHAFLQGIFPTQGSYISRVGKQILYHPLSSLIIFKKESSFSFFAGWALQIMYPFPKYDITINAYGEYLSKWKIASIK